MINTNRRRFLQASAGLSAGLGAGLYTTPSQAAAANHVLVYVFLRGGADGLHIVPPTEGPDRALYEILRPRLKIAANNTLALGEFDGNQFGLNPAAAPLHPLYQAGHLAIVQATGFPAGSSRSHFDAMAHIELGTPGSVSSASGWLHRYFDKISPQLPDSVLIPILAVGETPPTSLLGNHYTLTMNNPEQFSVGNSHWRWDDANKATLSRDAALRQFYPQDVNDALSQAGHQALVAETLIADAVAAGGFSDSSAYPDHHFGDDMRIVANMLKLDVGLRLVTVDFGNWDTHAGQDTGGFFADTQLGPLAQGLAAFFNDLDRTAASPEVTVVVQSEFGRRAYDNADGGTDHGTGNIMLVLGHSVNGGRFYGHWPGLAEHQLHQKEDLMATTDARQVLSEVIAPSLDGASASGIFPGFSTAAEPLGLTSPKTGGGGGTTITGGLFVADFE